MNELDDPFIAARRAAVLRNILAMRGAAGLPVDPTSGLDAAGATLRQSPQEYGNLSPIKRAIYARGQNNALSQPQESEADVARKQMLAQLTPAQIRQRYAEKRVVGSDGTKLAGRYDVGPKMRTEAGWVPDTGHDSRVAAIRDQKRNQTTRAAFIAGKLNPNAAAMAMQTGVVPNFPDIQAQRAAMIAEAYGQGRQSGRVDTNPEHAAKGALIGDIMKLPPHLRMKAANGALTDADYEEIKKYYQQQGQMPNAPVRVIPPGDKGATTVTGGPFNSLDWWGDTPIGRLYKNAQAPGVYANPAPLGGF